MFKNATYLFVFFDAKTCKIRHNNGRNKECLLKAYVTIQEEAVCFNYW